jgi:hypothetical protein
MRQRLISTLIVILTSFGCSQDGKQKTPATDNSKSDRNVSKVSDDFHDAFSRAARKLGGGGAGEIGNSLGGGGWLGLRGKEKTDQAASYISVIGSPLGGVMNTLSILPCATEYKTDLPRDF